MRYRRRGPLPCEGVISRVAVVPNPPLLVPELTVHSRPETERLREACLRAATLLCESSRDWIALGTDNAGPRTLGPETTGSFVSFGVDVPVRFAAGANGGPVDSALPLPALVAAWLRGAVGADRLTMRVLPEYESVAEGAETTITQMEDDSNRKGLLVLADGPSGPFDDVAREEADSLTSTVRGALERVDTKILTALDADVCRRFGLHGSAALRAMARIVDTQSGQWRGELLYSAAPFGIDYHVAVWTRRQ